MLTTPSGIRCGIEVAAVSTTVHQLKSHDHGPQHWSRVAIVGDELCDEVPEADRLVVALFALFHDSMRQNEDFDPEHGERGWMLANLMLPNECLTVEQRRQLSVACIHHDQGATNDDPTIGVCWDADRLDLPRVGITPHPKYLSTNAAQRRLAGGT